MDDFTCYLKISSVKNKAYTTLVSLDGTGFCVLQHFQKCGWHLHVCRLHETICSLFIHFSIGFAANNIISIRKSPDCFGTFSWDHIQADYPASCFHPEYH